MQALLHARCGSLWGVEGGGKSRVSPTLSKLGTSTGTSSRRCQRVITTTSLPALGTALYTAGGKTFFGWPASEWVNLDHVWSYHIPSGTWRVEPPMLEPGKGLYSGIAALDDELWLLGGLFRAGGGTRGDGDCRDIRS